MADAPTLAPGRYAIAIAKGRQDDVPTCLTPCVSPHRPESGEIVAVVEVEVTLQTRLVQVQGDFDSRRVTARTVPEVEPTPRETLIPAPRFVPPGSGIETCMPMFALFRIDADGTAWYEDIDTGRRIELVAPEGSMVHLGTDRWLTYPESEVPFYDMTIVGGDGSGWCPFRHGDTYWVSL